MVVDARGLSHRSQPGGLARDPDSLAYARSVFLVPTLVRTNKEKPAQGRFLFICGRERTRTPHPLSANEVLYQMSYAPEIGYL